MTNLMAKLFLLRHLQSQWNLENRFTGQTDIPLSEEGVESAKEVAKKFADLRIDKVYASPLIRNRKSASLILENLGKEETLVITDKALDERNYGKLQGLNKDEVRAKYGEEQVRLWQKSWDQPPPEGESLKDVYDRVVSFYQEHIEKDLKQEKNILVITSHNSLRALIKHIEKISDQEISNLDIKTGELREYEI